jgi:hypothetical protein
MKLQEMINEKIVDYYKEVEADVQKDTGESVLPLTAEDVEALIECEIGSLIQQISQKDYYTDKPLIKSDLVTLYIVEEVLWKVFDMVDYEALADKVNKELMQK